MGNAIARRREQLLGRTTVGSDLFREDQAREGISAKIYHIDDVRLSRITGCTTNGTKHWRAGTRCPNVASLINLARALPEVRAWLYEQVECGDRAAQAFSQEAVTRALVNTLSDPEQRAHLAQALGFIDRGMKK